MLTAFLLALPAALVLVRPPFHPQSSPPSSILFEGVRVLDVRAGSISTPRHVLIRGTKIASISASPIATGAETRVIAGGGRVLMPGLIDAHWHAMLVRPTAAQALVADVGYTTLLAAEEARATLLRGFTTVRDLGGPTSGLRRAIDEGLVPGPRIYPSGAMISQTGGHGDFRLPFEVPAARNAPLSRMEALNGGVIADGVDEVLRRAREQLMLGATQLKLHAGGGVASAYDPLDVAQYTVAEFRAAVSAAENWGTYVTVHAYTPRAIRMAVEGGVRCIEHGQLMDEDTAKLLAEKGVWLCLQPFLDDADANPQPEGSPNRAKQVEMMRGTETAYALAKKHGVRTAFGTDILFNSAGAAKQGSYLVKLSKWYTPAEILRMATADNAELLALSGPRNPYPGPLGVVEEGAYADLLLVDGNPLERIELIADPERGFPVIVKDGRVVKNALAAVPK